MTKPTTIRRQTRYGWDDFCFCGAKLGDPTHDRRLCLSWLQGDPDGGELRPSPGRGVPAPDDEPMVLYDEAEPAYVSKGLEYRCEVARGEHRRFLAALDRRAPPWAWVFVQIEAENRTAAELAHEYFEIRKVVLKPGTVRQWYARALQFRDEWKRKRGHQAGRRLEIMPDHDPSKSAAEKERRSLIAMNEDHARRMAGRAEEVA